jgi:hypothetical protein
MVAAKAKMEQQVAEAVEVTENLVAAAAQPVTMAIQM